MSSKLIALPALAAALLVSACAATTPVQPGPSPVPPPTNPNPPAPNPDPTLGYNALVVSGNGVRSANGTLEGDENSARVTVGSRTYAFSGGEIQGSSYGITAVEYGSGSNIDPNGAAIFAGQSAAAVVIADNVNQDGVFMIGGEQTEILPNQRALYDGIWTIVDNQGGGASGVFAADANFDSRRIAIGLWDGQDINRNFGSGTGTIQREGFTSSFNTNTASGLVSNNTVNGQFYGTNAAEMAGLVNGSTNTGASTAGMMIGSKRP